MSMLPCTSIQYAWLCVAALLPSAVAAGDSTFDSQVKPLLAKHCLGCHNEMKAKGKFRVDLMMADFEKTESRERWALALKRIRAGEMPPEDVTTRPSGSELQTLYAWAGQQSKAAAAKRAAEGRVVLRRLNRAEYENTVRDLLGVRVDLKSQLPADSSAHGFDNVGEALHTSSFLMEKYLEAADTALNVAITNKPQPKSTVTRVSLKECRPVQHTMEDVYKILDDGVVCLCSSLWHTVYFSKFYPSERGLYRFRISTSAYQSDGKPITFRVTVSGGQLSGKSGLIGYFDTQPGKPTVLEFEQYMEPKTTITLLPHGLQGAQAVKSVGSEKYSGPGLAVQFLEVEGPLNPNWPPLPHRRLFGNQPQGPAPEYNQSTRVEITSKSPAADADRILRSFVRRAFRRAVTDTDLKPYLDLVEAKLAEKRTFEQAIRAALLSVMVSPEFLFLRETKGILDDFSLASRLSYFLWSTMPDDELLGLAEQKKLSHPEVLKQQVERMLKDSRSVAFTENFVGQWLGLRDIDFTEPSQLLYPEFDHMLKVSMLKETELFFAEVLQENLNVTNFLASDFSMLNGRLAKHYGIEGVNGWEFRKVALPPGSHRGGVLTMASVLKVTANGTTTSPVLRGAWILDRILGTPPSPPPEGVAAFDPDIRGAVTIREQLAKHRNVPACASCHVKIDPPGFALESFDVIGGYRERYRVTGSGETVTVNGRRMSYHKGKAVDASDVMPDGQTFKNSDEFKQILLQQKEPFTRALVAKVLTYSTGGAPAPGNEADVEAIAKRVAEQGYGFRTLVHEVVQSRLFRTK